MGILPKNYEKLLTIPVQNGIMNTKNPIKIFKEEEKWSLP